MTSKWPVAVDALGHPLRLMLSAGLIADIDQASALIKNPFARFVVADQGYDSAAFVATSDAQGAHAVIPPRSNRRPLRSTNNSSGIDI